MQYRRPKKKSPYFVEPEIFDNVVTFCRCYPLWVKELQTLPDSSRAITYDKDKVQTSPMDQMLEALSEIDHYERERLKVVKTLIDIRSIIARKLIILPQKEYFVLNEYYLRLRSIKNIADDMECSVQYVYRLRNNGLSMLCKLEENDYV